MWLIAAVSRVMKPGSICKTMIILEGRQNAGKSTLLRRLCPRPEWFSDTPIDVGAGKDQFQSLRGKWIIEIPELDGFKGKDAHRIKSFISSPSDNYRKSFGKTNEDVPRQCVFAGSTNETHYLTDGTGNVRFWPVLVGEMDYDGIERDRDQLWAEAFSLYVDGKHWHITDPRVEELARQETEAREEEDVWLAPVRAWATGPIGRVECGRGVSIADVLLRALEVPKKDQSRAHQTRAGAVMKKIGFRQLGGRARPRLYVLGTEEVRPEEMW
jgi:putative DNA primase/helicase